MTVEMIQQATADTLALLFPEQRRYTAVFPLLCDAEPLMHNSLDMRPAPTIRRDLGLKIPEWKQLLSHTSAVPRALVMARVSDLFYLLLTGLIPFPDLLALMRQNWPFTRRSSGSSCLETPAACLSAGRFNLIEYPLIRLPLVQHNEIENVWFVVKSECETPERSAPQDIDVREKTGGERDR